MSAENTSSEIQDQHSTEPFSLKNTDDFPLSNEDNPGMEVMLTSQFGKEKLSTSGASISRICETDEDGKLDVLPCEQQVSASTGHCCI